MVLMIVCLDQLLWRPLVVWVEKFRLDDTTGGGPAPGSWVLDFLRRARLPRRGGPLPRPAPPGGRPAGPAVGGPPPAPGAGGWGGPRPSPGPPPPPPPAR